MIKNHIVHIYFSNITLPSISKVANKLETGTIASLFISNSLLDRPHAVLHEYRRQLIITNVESTKTPQINFLKNKKMGADRCHRSFYSLVNPYDFNSKIVKPPP